MLSELLTGDLFFPAAFAHWMKHRTLDTLSVATNARYLAKSSDRDYRNCASALERFPGFRDVQIRDIGPDLLMQYQEARALNAEHPHGKWWCLRGARAQGPFDTRAQAEAWAAEQGNRHKIKQSLWSMPAGANRIRKEVQMMVRVLRDAKLWGADEEAALLRLRPVENEMARAMTIEEQHRFLHVAASRLEYRLVHQYAIVALQTTASTNEMRALRLCDVLLENRVIQIPPRGSKNTFRMRTIPIVTEDAMWALEGLMARARDLGSTSPTHYLFPFHVTQDRYDPTRPISENGMSKAWNAVRLAAGLPSLRMYDLRHTGITRMAEAGVPLPVAMTFAGHMTRQSQQRYTAICLAAQRGWGEAVWGDSRAMATVPELSKAWPPRKPIRSEGSDAYQNRQHLHRRG